MCYGRGMHKRVAPFFLLSLVLACSSSTRDGFGGDPDAAVGADPDAGSFGGGGGAAGGAAPLPTVTTVYANTDDSLFSLDPATKKVALIGKFVGVEADDPNVTDCAV